MGKISSASALAIAEQANRYQVAYFNTGAQWYMLTADYAFGHDLFRVSSRTLRDIGLPTQGLVRSLLGFNAGVELGHALVGRWQSPGAPLSAPTLSTREACATLGP